MKSLGEEALTLINFMIEEEQSDMDNKLITKGYLKEKPTSHAEIDDDLTWKLRRVQVLKFIIKRIKGLQ